MLQRWLVDVEGRVQGVGFRPFIYRLAVRLGVNGSVCNTRYGVAIDVEGDGRKLQEFVDSIRSDLPAEAFIDKLRWTEVQPSGFSSFEIYRSCSASIAGVRIPRDIAPCVNCVRELFDPTNRRYGYPFITCVTCGPRYTVIESFPFDRATTVMRDFPLCEVCLSEYSDPANPRYHAQTISCSYCGPILSASIRDSVYVLRLGGVILLKGVGGFQLLCDAANPQAIRRIRKMKHRPEKPLAILFPDLASIGSLCNLNDLEIAALQSSSAPIVLLSRKSRDALDVVDSLVAPQTDLFGCMLPSSPLHYLVSHHFGRPLIVTSANHCGDPIALDISSFSEDFLGEVDLILDHNRRIVRRVDDSVVRCIGEKIVNLRLGRGLAPLSLPAPAGVTSLGVGGHGKATISLIDQQQMTMMPHIGDLAGVRTIQTFENTVDFLLSWVQCRPEVVVTDLNPSFYSYTYAETLGSQVERVQHHHAHILACMLEHQIKGSVLGLAWDGTGLGNDHRVWGGEALVVDGIHAERIAHLREFPLPGGEQAIREPRRSALGIGFQVAELGLSREHFDEQTLEVLCMALRRRLNCPLTTSVGRLFDAVAALLGLVQITTYSDQAPVLVESIARRARVARRYDLPLRHGVFDWEPLWRSMLVDRTDGVPRQEIALGFHRALGEAAVAVARYAGESRVVLTGGCFQNALLAEIVLASLKDAGFCVYSHSIIPANDGGLAAGQAFYGVLKSTGASACV